MGQHQCEIEAQICTDFPHIISLEATVKGETIQLVKMVPAELESEIIAELEIDYRDYLRDQAEDRRIDDYLARAA